MKLEKALEDALNEQLKEEFYAAYVYLSMAAYCISTNLNGFAHWLKAQAREEVEHAMRLYAYLDDRDARIRLKAIDQPAHTWKSPVDLFQNVLKHEQAVSEGINDLYAMAVKQKDYASQAFLNWFVTEQIEEEKTASQILEMLKMAGDNRSALLMLDKELGSRQLGG